MVVTNLRLQISLCLVSCVLVEAEQNRSSFPKKKAAPSTVLQLGFRCEAILG